MMRKLNALYYDKDSMNEYTEVSYDAIDICPVCKKGIVPDPITGVVYTHKTGLARFSVLEYCGACYSVVMSTFDVTQVNRGFSYTRCVHSVPQLHKARTFDKDIEEAYPRFVDIYNQALEAESCELNEIAGMGFRKALEFLIKDFAIGNNPEFAEEIRKAPLSSVITSYIDDTRIKELATKSAWLGNDETHYERKHDDRDISDLKRFIDATVYFIGMMAIHADALSVERK